MRASSIDRRGIAKKDEKRQTASQAAGKPLLIMFVFKVSYNEF